MKKDNTVYLADILEAIKKIEEYVTGMGYSDFCDDNLVKDAVVKNLEIIGEAANRLTDDFIENHSDFPVKEAVSMRNFLIHDYSNMDVQVIWETIKDDLPGLKRQVEGELQIECFNKTDA